MENIKSRGLILLAIVAVAVSLFYLLSGNEGKVRVPFPLTYGIADNTSFACESLMSGYIVGSEKKDLINGIEVVVEKGTDTIAMKIKDEHTLEFLTRASLSIGVTEGDKFAIVQNDAEKLMAVYFDASGVDTVVINKKNGLALWLKGSPEFLGQIYGAPRGQVIYLICR